MSIAQSSVGRRKKGRSSILDQQFVNPNKGLDVYASEQEIGDLEASGALNCRVTDVGCVDKAFGWEKVGVGLQNAPRGMFSYYPTGANPMLCTIDGDTLKYISGAPLPTSLWMAAGGGIKFQAADSVCGVQAGGAMWVWNGKDPGSKLVGTTVSRPTTTVHAAFGIYFADKQIVSGVAEHPNRLYISSPTDVGDFTNANPTGTGPYSVYDTTTHPGASTFAGSDANYIDIALDDGDRITGLSKYASQLIIFKERSIYAMSFDSQGIPTVTLVTGAVGCVSHFTIDAMDNDIIFLSRRGYYIFGNQANFQDQLRTNELSVQIRPMVSAVRPSNLDRSTGIWHENTYFGASAVGNSPTNNRVFTYQREYGAWFPHKNMQPNAFTEFIDSNNVECLYYADENTATVWRQTDDKYNHGDDPIAMYWESKVYDFGRFGLQKRYVDLTLFFHKIRGACKVTVTVDGVDQDPVIIPGSSFGGGMGRGLMGASIVGGKDEADDANQVTPRSKNVPYRLTVGVIGRTIKFRVENATLGEHFALQGYNFGFRPYGRNSFPSELRIYS